MHRAFPYIMIVALVATILLSGCTGARLRGEKAIPDYPVRYQPARAMPICPFYGDNDKIRECWE